MTIQDAVEQGIDKLTRPEWAHNSYMELHLTGDGHCGPWVKIVTIPLTPVAVALWELPDDGWEKWVPA